MQVNSSGNRLLSCLCFTNPAHDDQSIPGLCRVPCAQRNALFTGCTATLDTLFTITTSLRPSRIKVTGKRTNLRDTKHVCPYYDLQTPFAVKIPLNKTMYDSSLSSYLIIVSYFLIDYLLSTSVHHRENL